jgi:hypothetical protein
MHDASAAFSRPDHCTSASTRTRKWRSYTATT